MHSGSVERGGEREGSPRDCIGGSLMETGRSRAGEYEQLTGGGGGSKGGGGKKEFIHSSRVAPSTG